mmetsp:Transcript_116285/g.323931  ORF Transcript_116285/g.323931 Transcript_116285/m.323931 type:complete len:243 (+) Transcript_116285:19-747(+)
MVAGSRASLGAVQCRSQSWPLHPSGVMQKVKLAPGRTSTSTSMPRTASAAPSSVAARTRRPAATISRPCCTSAPPRARSSSLRGAASANAARRSALASSAAAPETAPRTPPGAPSAAARAAWPTDRRLPPPTEVASPKEKPEGTSKSGQMTKVMGLPRATSAPPIVKPTSGVMSRLHSAATRLLNSGNPSLQASENSTEASVSSSPLGFAPPAPKESMRIQFGSRRVPALQPMDRPVPNSKP